jgi:hypothetical protein
MKDFCELLEVTRLVSQNRNSDLCLCRERAVLSTSSVVLKRINLSEGLKIDKRVSIVVSVSYLQPILFSVSWQSVFIWR